jgi:hypothetical protein
MHRHTRTPPAARHAVAVLLAGAAACAPARPSAAGAAPAGVAGRDPAPAATRVDLAARALGGGLRVPGGRAVTALVDGVRRGVRVADGPGGALAWLDDVEIGDGVIELDVRGKDAFQQSFPGVAFRAAGDSAYDAVYLRPFNFRAADPVRRQHAVQYVARPDYDFDRLRRERPEEFENPVEPAPDPNGWVHLRVVLAGPRVSVYVGEGAEPDLVVRSLSGRGRGRVALHNPGDYANLSVRPAGP